MKLSSAAAALLTLLGTEPVPVSSQETASSLLRGTAEAATEQGPNKRDLLACLLPIDRDGCDGTDMSDGRHCAWCSSDHLGVSFCATPDASEMMKQLVQDLDCDGGDDVSADLEAGVNPQDLLICLQSADKDGCDGTATSDGHCAWCSSDTLGMSFCTTPDAGEMMKQFVQDLDCDGSVDSDLNEDAGINPQDLLICLQSADKDGCDGTATSDGHCAWCSSDTLGMSFCTTPDAGEMMKQFVQDLDCDGSGSSVVEDAGINPQDLLICLQSADKGGCDGTATSDGHCAWCSSDTLGMSFCTTPDAGEMMKQFVQDLDCDGSVDLNEDAGINPQDLLICLQSADKGGCDGTAISDGHCAWCSSETLGMSFCTTPDAGEMMKQFVQDLDCDSGSSVVAIN